MRHSVPPSQVQLCPGRGSCCISQGCGGRVTSGDSGRHLLLGTPQLRGAAGRVAVCGFKTCHKLFDSPPAKRWV